MYAIIANRCSRRNAAAERILDGGLAVVAERPVGAAGVADRSGVRAPAHGRGGGGAMKVTCSCGVRLNVLRLDVLRLDVLRLSPLGAQAVLRPGSPSCGHSGRRRRGRRRGREARPPLPGRDRSPFVLLAEVDGCRAAVRWTADRLAAIEPEGDAERFGAFVTMLGQWSDRAVRTSSSAS